MVSEKGLGKRTQFFEKLEVDAAPEDKVKAIRITNEEGAEDLYQTTYRITNRGGKGVKTINITEKTGALAGLLGVQNTEDLMIICRSGMTIRMKVEDIREAGRATQGVKLINLGQDEISAIARIQEQEENEDEEAEDMGTGGQDAAGAEGESSSEDTDHIDNDAGTTE